MVTARTYRELEIWREAMDVCERIYRSTELFPRHERFGIVSQMRRASLSIPSNIAEGFVRKHSKEFRQFLSIAVSSLAELDTQLLLSCRLEFLSQDDTANIMEMTDRLGRKITRFLQAVRTT